MKIGDIVKLRNMRKFVHVIGQKKNGMYFGDILDSSYGKSKTRILFTQDDVKINKDKKKEIQFINASYDEILSMVYIQSDFNHEVGMFLFKGIVKTLHDAGLEYGLLTQLIELQSLSVGGKE